MVPLTAIDKADTGWVMVASALVLLMTLPGIALFYAGLVRRKNVVNTMVAVFAVACVVTLTWFGLGYSLAFTAESAWLGNLGRAWFASLHFDGRRSVISVSHLAPHLPEAAYALFQAAFAIITTSLIVGAVVERMRFAALLVFAALWSVVVYAPVAHWVWESGGWLNQLGALDFAGGAVVHVNAGVAALVCAFMMGRRRGYGTEPFEPHSLGWTAWARPCCCSAGSASTPDRPCPPTGVQRWPLWSRWWRPRPPDWHGWWWSGWFAALRPCWDCSRAWWAVWSPSLLPPDLCRWAVRCG